MDLAFVNSTKTDWETPLLYCSLDSPVIQEQKSRQELCIKNMRTVPPVNVVVVRERSGTRIPQQRPETVEQGRKENKQKSASPLTKGKACWMRLGVA